MTPREPYFQNIRWMVVIRKLGVLCPVQFDPLEDTRSFGFDRLALVQLRSGRLDHRTSLFRSGRGLGNTWCWPMVVIGAVSCAMLSRVHYFSQGGPPITTDPKTNLIKGQCMSKHSDRRIRIGERQGSSHNNPHTRNSIPTEMLAN